MAVKICFVELPATSTASMKTFYSGAFGLEMTDFGPTYACTLTGTVDLGVQADRADVTRSPLAVLQVDDVDIALAAVTRAGGVVTKATFSFPGGRRFHFRDPGGNELAAMQAD